MKQSIEKEGFVSRAYLRNFGIPPQKVRLVVDLIRGKQIDLALELLDTCDKRTAPAVKKLLLSAVANARDLAKIDVDELYVRSIFVDEGRKVKRWLPRAHGRATKLWKRSSHITVVLDEIAARKKK